VCADLIVDRVLLTPALIVYTAVPHQVPKVLCSSNSTYTSARGDTGSSIVQKFYPHIEWQQAWAWLVSCNPQMQRLYTGKPNVTPSIPMGSVISMVDTVHVALHLAQQHTNAYRLYNMSTTTGCGCSEPITATKVSLSYLAHSHAPEVHALTAMKEFARCNPEMTVDKHGIIASSKKLSGICPAAWPVRSAAVPSQSTHRPGTPAGMLPAFYSNVCALACISVQSVVTGVGLQVRACTLNANVFSGIGMHCQV
jgi:hypothetical protein